LVSARANALSPAWMFLSKLRITVVGAGIVGLAVAYHLAKAGARVTVIDRDPEGDKTSAGNAGGIAVTEVVPASSPAVWWRVFGWMLDPLGPLAVRPAHAPSLVPWLWRFAKAGTPRERDRISQALAALNSRVYDDLLPMLDDIGFSTELNRSGALSVYETEAGFRRDASEWDCKRTCGVVAEEVTAAEARRMEPALGPRVVRAVYTPQWSHINDPRQLLQGLRNWLTSRGVVISRGEVLRIGSDSNSKVSLELAGGPRVVADRIVVAAGAWSGSLARQMGDRVPLESERGYNVTLPHSGIALRRQLIFAERKFVATPLSCGLRIGGAAEFGGLNAPANFQRSRALSELARRYLPGLRIEGGTNWAGHRPATPDSLPVIGPSAHQPNVFYAFGHGHLGLTQAATTGRLVCGLIHQAPQPIDLRPYGIARFNGGAA
jgi:D-amino-acid dehydrogenase